MFRGEALALRKSSVLCKWQSEVQRTQGSPTTAPEGCAQSWSRVSTEVQFFTSVPSSEPSGQFQRFKIRTDTTSSKWTISLINPISLGQNPCSAVSRLQKGCRWEIKVLSNISQPVWWSCWRNSFWEGITSGISKGRPVWVQGKVCCWFWKSRKELMQTAVRHLRKTRKAKNQEPPPIPEVLRELGGLGDMEEECMFLDTTRADWY